MKSRERERKQSNQRLYSEQTESNLERKRGKNGFKLLSLMNIESHQRYKMSEKLAAKETKLPPEKRVRF